MPIVYKLTDQDMCTRNNTKWVLGEWKEEKGDKEGLCSSGWLHCYQHPLIAEFMNMAHACFDPYRLFEAEADGKELHDGFKSGYTRMRLVKELPIVKPTDVQFVDFGLHFLLQTSFGKPRAITPDWRVWAENWLSGKDRTVETADKLKYSSGSQLLLSEYRVLNAAHCCSPDSSIRLRNNVCWSVLAYVTTTEQLVESATKAMEVKGFLKE